MKRTSAKRPTCDECGDPRCDGCPTPTQLAGTIDQFASALSTEMGDPEFGETVGDDIYRHATGREPSREARRERRLSAKPPERLVVEEAHVTLDGDRRFVGDRAAALVKKILTAHREGRAPMVSGLGEVKLARARLKRDAPAVANLIVWPGRGGRDGVRLDI